MKKKTAARIVLGFPVGIAIGNVITVVISLIWGGGNYFVCVPEFTKLIGSESAAAALQTLICGIMGIGFSAASLIWENDKISLLKQTVLCFFIYSVLVLPAAFFMGWMERSITGFIIYTAIFAAIFAVIWLTQFLLWKVRINSINAMLKK